MSKAGKRVKSGSGQGGAKWEQALLSAQFDEENWKANITFVVGNKVDDYTWIDILGSTIASGPRKLFSVISRQKLEEEVRELGNPKGKKPKDVPQHYEVTEPCKIHLDNNEDIPFPLLARLIKYKLLAIKTADIKRRETEKKASLDKDKARKGSGGKGGKERGKSPPKGKGGKKTPEPPAAKEGSKLRKRGEEDDEGKYIDDEPDDGAQHYIIVYGYNSPHLITQLGELSINIDSVLRMSSQDYTRFVVKDDVPAVEKDEKTQGKDKAAQKAVLEEVERATKLKIKKELQEFWRDVLLVLQKQADGSRLHDIARQEYEVKNLLIPEDLEDAEQKNVFGLAMFEDVACMIYDLIDSRRHYKNYLENLRLLHVPMFGQATPPAQEERPAVSGAPTPSAQQPPAPSVPSIHPDMLEVAPQVDMRFYNDLMSCVPQESVSVSLIMHAMLDQVVATEENNDPPSEQLPPKRQDGLNSELATHISGLAFKLALSEDEQKILSDVFDTEEQPPETPGQPLLMNYHDKISARTNHLKKIFNFNPEVVEKDMLKRLPFASLTHIPRPGSRIARERAARLQELIHFCATGGLSQSEIDRAFKQFVFESMDLASTDPNGFIITRDSEGVEHSAIPWDDPYPFFKGMIPTHLKGVKDEVDVRSSRSVTINLIPWSFSGLSDLIDYSLPGTPSPPPEPSSALKGAAPEFQKSVREPEPQAQPVDNRAAENKLHQSRSRTKKNKTAMSPTTSKSVKTEEKSVSIEDQREGSRPSSTDSKKGILRPPSRSRSSSGGHRSRSNSVHFEKDEEGKPIRHYEEEDELDVVETEPDKTTEESLMEIVDAQKRNLDQWCFAEHYEPNVLLQVIREASFLLPFMDMYYHKRDNSLMLVLHNPSSLELQNHVDWHTELHCNLGFRNYMECVAESIADWNQEEEAKYQAVLLSKELVKMRDDEEASIKSAEKAKGRKSPRKSPSRSKSPGKNSRSSSQERPSSATSNMFVRANSLKAWKEEQDRMKAEEEEKEREKSAKRVKSGKKAEKEKEDKKAPGSRASAKSKTSAKEPTDEQPKEDGDVAPVEEKYWPFTGYDVGNKLIHVAGMTTTLFPSDGGQIRTEKLEFTQGTNSVKTSVLKDGHVFCVHVIDPKEGEEDSEEENEENKDEVEKSEHEKSEKDQGDKMTKDGDAGSTARSNSARSEEKKTKSVSAFGCITANLQDGMTLSLSQFGPTGVSEDGKKYEPKVYVPPPTTPSPVPPPSPTKSKKGDKGKGAPTPEAPPPVTPQETEKEEDQEEKKDEEKPVLQPFQQLYVSSPDGLSVKYLLESSVGMKPLSDDDRRLLIKQSYPFKTRGEQPCEAKRRKYALSEQSRIITSEGTVVKNMMDGSIEVLYADGTVSVHTGPWASKRSGSSSPQRAGSARSQTGERAETPTKKAAVSAKGKASKSQDKIAEQAPEEDVPEVKGTWVTTYPNGEKVACKSDGNMEELKSVMISLASDPQTSQSMATRDDHVITISYPDGTTIIEHADGTRITTYYKENQISTGEEEYEDNDIKEFETQTVKFVKVECPAYATVEFNCLTSENLTIFGNGTTINVFPDGYYMLHQHDGGRVEVDMEGTLTYYPRPIRNMEQLLPERELQYILCHNADVVVETVDSDGNVFNVKSNGDFTVIPVNGDALSESSMDENKIDKKLTTYREHAPRFFILHSDGSGTELLRYQDVAEYINTAEHSPATAVLKDDLPDYPGVQGITILKPYLGGPSEKFFKKYDQESIIPPGIRCRDLTTLPPKEFKTPGPGYGKNVGQGLSVGAAVRQPIRIPILKCPNILELRQLIQYKPVSGSLRESLQAGVKEYAEFVTERNKVTNMMQVVDPRTDEERIHAADLTEIGLQTAQRELPQYEPANIKGIYEKVTAPPVPSPPPTPQPKRTMADWERDQREMNQEMDGRDALRKKRIPTYFDSEFGKAFLLTQAKDVDEILQQLSEDPRKDGTEAVRGNSSSQSNNPQQISPDTSAYPARSVAAVTSVQSDRSSTSPVDTLHPKQVSDTPISYAVYAETVPSRGGIRPGNPTPAHATGQGSPAPLRPDNPTPGHAVKTSTGRPYNPTPKHAGGQIDSPSDLPSQLDYPAIIMEQPLEEEDYSAGEVPEGENELILTRSLKMDVTGRPRKEAVVLPRGIKGGRPGAIPNTKYKTVEVSVRRKVNTSVTAGASVPSQVQLERMRGLILLPEEIDFGVLREGNTYICTVCLKNTGVDSCRFKIRQPPPATGLRINYKLGPIAAGMKTDLECELYAIAVGVEGESGVGSIRHDLEIVTETDILFLPITATVLTADAYDNRSPNSPQGGKSPGTRLVSTRPPQSTGIIRPRKNPFPGPPQPDSTYVR
ncbi:sperm-associated antigen 17-like isoform X1 [Pecten maximus]|uniref:sperm-associated antigen 17-like isoform X1 n=1 Tax=Pecten maximus TaxID=6579 RepID=UPI00145801A4|nr:sperm-associated antigen 17-like isoform X1 [Pecten maximus]